MTKIYHEEKDNLGLTFKNYFKKPACLHLGVAKRVNIIQAIMIVFCFAASGTAFGQGVFTSAATGDWNNAGSWTLSSGTDVDGIPDADDDVTINDNHTITTTAAITFTKLTMLSQSKLIINGIFSSALPSTGAVYTFSSGAIIEYQGGAQTIADINYPNLIINATGAKTFNTTTNSASRTVAGNVTVSANRLGISASILYPVTVNGNITVSGTSSNILMSGGDLICRGNLTLSATGGTVTAPTLWFASTAARVMGGTAQGTGTFTVGTGACVRNIYSNTSADSKTQNPISTQFPFWQTLDLQTGSTWQYAIPASTNGTRYQDVQDFYNGSQILYKTLVLSYLNGASTGSNVNTTITNPSIANALSSDITASAASVTVSQNITFANTSSLTIPSFTTSQFAAAITTNQNITFGAQPVIVTGNVSIVNPTATQLGTSTVVTLNAGSLSIGGTLTLGSTTASTTLNNPYILLNNAASALSVTGATILRSSEQTNGNIKFTNSAQTVTFNGGCTTANGNATAEIFNFNGFSPTINFNNNFTDGAVGSTFAVTGTEVPVINFNNGTSGTPATSTASNLRGTVTVNGYRQVSGNFSTANAVAAAYSMNVAGTLDLGASTSVATNTGGGTNTLNGSGTIKFTGAYASQVSGYSANNFQGAGTLHFAGSSAQTIPSGTYGSIIVDNAAGANLSGNTTVNNALTLTSGTLSTGANTLTLKGATSGAGLIETSTLGTLVYNGAAAQIVSNLTAGTVNSLTIDNAAGVSIGTNTVVNNDVTITAGSAATVLAAKNLTVNNAVINNGTFTVQNNANLIQVNNVANSGSGSTIVKRASNPLFRSDYTLWSSPVTGSQTLLDFSPLTVATRFYTYDNTQGATGLYAAVNSPSTTTFTAATGYLIRMPDADSATDYNAGKGTLAYLGSFTGTPNNGTLTVGSITPLVSDKYYAVGNPYPSTISAAAFLAANSTDGVLYFWRKKNAELGTAYATFTTGGGTTTTPTSAAPDGTIAVGQGFIVKTGGAATTLSFANTMRTGNSTAQFFKTRQVAQKDRVWLNLTNTTGVFSQALVGYITDASLGLDIYDGKYINDSPIALTSNINNQEYTIQGRPTFDGSDVVVLNFKTNVAGDYSIAIDHVDGLFSGIQDIYLVDSKTGTETNLKTSSYTFTAAAGVDNARFSLKYQKTLDVNTQGINDNNVIVYKNNDMIYVNLGAKTINNIKVFDIQGRLILERNNVKANTTSIQYLNASNQILIVKVTTEDNQVISKKVEN